MPQNILEMLKQMLPEFVTGAMPPDEEASYPPYTQSDPNYPGTPGPPNIPIDMHTANIHPGQVREYQRELPFFQSQRPRDIDLSASTGAQTIPEPLPNEPPGGNNPEVLEMLMNLRNQYKGRRFDPVQGSGLPQ
jgi:hypothetical protein